MAKVEEESKYAVGCCSVTAVAVNHCGIQFVKFALEGLCQQTMGCDPAHMEACPCRDGFILLLF